MYDTTKPYTKEILELIKQTWETPYVSVEDGIIRKKFWYPETDSVDGIGTKGVYHLNERTFKEATLDSLAMNLNDLAMKRAVPYKLLDHLTIPRDDSEAIFKIIKTLVQEAKKRNIAITGGETAIEDIVEGIGISISMDGFIREYKPNRFEVGDVLIGIKSNGLHSNGFTKVREVFGDEHRPEFVAPTTIYSDAILKLNEKFDIHGMMHITGGAYTKLRGLLHNSNAIIRKDHKLQPQPIFSELYEQDVSDEEMYKTFNCGIGFVLSVSPEEASKIVSELNTYRLESDVIGEVIPGKGKVKIQSAFSKEKLEF